MICLLLLGHTHRLSAAARRASVLTTDAQTVRVADTTVSTDLLQALKIVTELDGNGVGQDVLGLAGLGVALTVEEPSGDLVLQGIGEDVGQTLNLLVGEGTSTALNIDVGLLANQEGETDTNTLDATDGEGHLPLSLNVGVEETDDVLELLRR